jgi:hypothetical protein
MTIKYSCSEQETTEQLALHAEFLSRCRGLGEERAGPDPRNRPGPADPCPYV